MWTASYSQDVHYKNKQKTCNLNFDSEIKHKVNAVLGAKEKYLLRMESHMILWYHNHIMMESHFHNAVEKLISSTTFKEKANQLLKVYVYSTK